MSFIDKVSPEPNTGCWLWTASCDVHGYGRVRAGGRLVGAHRLAYELFVGPIPAGVHVLHTCDIRCCVNPSHLFLGTNADNHRDKAIKGRAANRKLTDDDVRLIRASGESRRALAARFNVCPTTINDTIHRRIFRHLP